MPGPFDGGGNFGGGGFGSGFGGANPNFAANPGGTSPWPYGVNPATYIQQALGGAPTGPNQPNFRSQWYQPPNQQSPLRDQLVSLFGNALMSQSAFPQIMQTLMQRPDAARLELGLLSPPQSYSPDKDFWRINWNIPPTGAAANTSAASGGNQVFGTRPGIYGGAAVGAGDGSANGATSSEGAQGATGVAGTAGTSSEGPGVGSSGSAAAGVGEGTGEGVGGTGVGGGTSADAGAVY